MLQYVKFNELTVNEKKYQLPGGGHLFRFFALKAFFLLFMIYSTLFLAVATPFLSPHSPLIYFLGGMICTVIFVRLINYSVKAVLCSRGFLSVSKSGIKIGKKGGIKEIAAADITYMEYSLLGDFVVRGKNFSEYFPAGMLAPADRSEMLAQFADMAPSRTALFRKIWEVGDAVVMAMILAVHIIQFVIQNFYIPTGSMETTLMVGDHLFAEKLTYGPRIPRMLGMKDEIRLEIPFITRDVHRGDVIIFHPPAPADETKDYIKRCVAVGGDDFHIRDGYVWINGVKQDEQYTQGIT
ncbi:MAG: signal peptidase I, partial [Spirochaetota bacterium]